MLFTHRRSPLSIISRLLLGRFTSNSLEDRRSPSSQIAHLHARIQPHTVHINTRRIQPRLI